MKVLICGSRGINDLSLVELEILDGFKLSGTENGTEVELTFLVED
jgi:hypothetical protein